MKAIDLTGYRFGRLLVLAKSPRQQFCNIRWLCKCDCGNETVAIGNNLRNGHTVSCGCFCKNKMRELHLRHGHAGRSGRSKDYSIWSAMLRRCFDVKLPAYPDYGGRGISVCDAWHTFENFYADMGPCPSAKHSIERINNDLGYDKTNCKWATWKEQQNNRRDNHRIEFNGMTRTLSQWSQHIGIPYYTLKSRISRGWTTEQALMEPVQKTLRRARS